MVVANRSTCGILIELMAEDVQGKKRKANVMVYISLWTDKFYISRNSSLVS